MAERASASRQVAAYDETSADRWLGGRLTLAQPKHGHRAGSEAALLIAAAGNARGRIVDVGAGVGAVGLALAQRSAEATVALVEIDPGLARLAEENAVGNGFDKRVRVLVVDVLRARGRRDAGLNNEAADCVVTNPPFYEPGTVRASPDAGRARAHVFSLSGGATLADWIRACLALLAPGGRFVMIHRPEALAAILAAAENRLGAHVLLPVHPRAGVSAHRLLVSGVRVQERRCGSRRPLFCIKRTAG